MKFRAAACPEGSGLLRIEADFVLDRDCAVTYGGEEWRFRAGDRFGLFYSYRHTPERVKGLFSSHGLTLQAQWLNRAGDEGVFLLQRSAQLAA